jgi:O-antigen ligase
MATALSPGASLSPRGWAVVGLLGLIVGVFAAVANPVVGALVIVAALGLLGSAYAPGLVLAAYLFVGFYKGALQAYSPVDLTVLLALMSGLQIVPLVLDHRERHVPIAGLALWAALALLILGGALYAPSQALALNKVALWWGLMFLPMIPAAMRVGSEERYVRQFMLALFGLAALVVAAGIASLSPTERLVVLGENTIEVSRAALLVPLLGVVYVARQRSKSLLVLAIVLTPPAFVVALASGSRGPLLFLAVLGVGAVIRSLFMPGGLNWRLAGIAAGLALVSIVVVSAAATRLPGESTSRFGSFSDFFQGEIAGESNSSSLDMSAGIRVSLSDLAISLFEEHPLLGVGTGGFESLSHRYLPPKSAEPYPHNAFLQVAAEFGMVGIIVFVGLVGFALTRRLPPGPSIRAVRVLYLYFLLNSLVSMDMYTDRATWGLLLLLLLIDTPPITRRLREAPDPAHRDSESPA